MQRHGAVKVCVLTNTHNDVQTRSASKNAAKRLMPLPHARFKEEAGGGAGQRQRETCTELTLLLREDNLNGAAVKVAAIPVILGIFGVPPIQELDEGKGLLLPVHAVSRT